MRLLLVEDDLMLGKAIKNALESEYNVVDWVMDFTSCDAALKTTTFEAILLDINLPDKSGLEILKNLRFKKNSTPVLIITARDSVSQKVEGLDLGADDYLAKPFDLDELFARIRSVVRRGKGVATPLLTHSNIELNSIAHTVTQNGNRVELSPKEFAILKLLLENLGKVISRNHLENLLYSWDDSVESNAIEVHIHHLRKKLGSSLVKTIRGAGYVVEK